MGLPLRNREPLPTLLTDLLTASPDGGGHERNREPVEQLTSDLVDAAGRLSYSS